MPSSLPTQVAQPGAVLPLAFQQPGLNQVTLKGPLTIPQGMGGPGGSACCSCVLCCGGIVCSDPSWLVLFPLLGASQ